MSKKCVEKKRVPDDDVRRSYKMIVLAQPPLVTTGGNTDDAMSVWKSNISSTIHGWEEMYGMR